MLGRPGQRESLSQVVSRRSAFLFALALALAILCGSAAGVASAAVDNTPPEVVGSAKIGERLLCDSGSWTGSVSRFEYAWYREGIKVGSKVEYILSEQDAGSEVWCVVTAVEGQQHVEAESINSVKIPGPKKEEPKLPEVVKAPEVKDEGEVQAEGKVGQNLTCSEGTWTGTPAPTFTYRWLRSGKRSKAPKQTPTKWSRKTKAIRSRAR